MYEVIILKEGYSAMDDTSCSQMKASGSSTLLKGPQNIIVDTGNPWDRELILERLLQNEISPEQISYVVCSSGHVDKVGNLNLFPRASHIVGFDLCVRDQFYIHEFDQGIPYEIDEHVEVLPTPGHTGSDVSVIVRNTSRGTVVIAGDLFECEGDLENPHLWQRHSENPELQQNSRLRVLKKADHIVPGHGGMFKVPESYKSQPRSVLIYEEFTHTWGSGFTETVAYNVIEVD